jgi:manganese/zinc/iron transport system permease protein
LRTHLLNIDWNGFLDVMVLANWNTRVVVLGVTALGIAGGVVGTFMLLRRRALLGDALSHATLPGIVLAFLVASMLGLGGKSHGLLMLGALLSGVLGIGAVHWLTRSGRLSEDSALGIVLSTFFGAGAALLGLAQQETSASAAGLETFIYGKTASMLARDALLIGATSIATIGCCVVFFKELRLVCFDPDFARGRGMRTGGYDFLLMSLVMAVVVVGLQAVGLVLVIAILVIPPAAARFWTNMTGRMLLVSGFIGGLGGWLGTMLSALAPGLPAGAMVVLALGGIFLVSLLVGRRHGLLRRMIRLRRRSLSMESDHALRAIWECMEQSGNLDCLSSQVGFRWGWATFRTAKRLQQAGLLVVEALGGDERISFTPSGEREAASVVRRHRLWEHYLMRRADFDEQHVDRGADDLEHLLPIDLLEELEKELDADTRAMLPSPHALRSGDRGGEGA